MNQVVVCACASAQTVIVTDSFLLLLLLLLPLLKCTKFNVNRHIFFTRHSFTIYRTQQYILINNCERKKETKNNYNIYNFCCFSYFSISVHWLELLMLHFTVLYWLVDNINVTITWLLFILNKRQYVWHTINRIFGLLHIHSQSYTWTLYTHLNAPTQSKREPLKLEICR